MEAFREHTAEEVAELRGFLNVSPSSWPCLPGGRMMTRLRSRARAALAGFVERHCGVANPANACRCRYQIKHNVPHGRMDLKQLRFAVPIVHTSLEAMRAHGEIQQVRRSLELYRAQRQFEAPEDFAERVRELLEASPAISS